MTAVTIRLATDDDANAIARVLAEAFVAYRPLYTDGAFSATAIDSRGVTARIVEGPVWVAVESGAVIGTVAAVGRGEDLYIRGMAVAPAARGCGVGTQLLEGVEAFARKGGYRRLVLSTTPFLTEAIHLYERSGFGRVPEGAMDLFGTPLFSMAKDVGPDPRLGRLR